MIGIRKIGVVWAAATVVLGGAVALPATAGAAPAHPASPPRPASRVCPPSAVALSFSDALDKVSVGGVQVGGLSDLAYDARSHSYVSSVDNHASDPARLWFYRNLDDPKIVGAPLVLRKPDGTPYDGATSDNEGLAVLPDGDFLVSSETEPSIRIYGRNGVQKAQLPVPARFAVAPAGEATGNATLEGLTITPSGSRIVAAMEGALSGDVSASGDATYHRFLVYDCDRHGKYQLTKQIGYRADPGNRISEVAAYGQNQLLVMEAAFSTTAGNSIQLYAVTTVGSARDVSKVANLSGAPARDIMRKSLVSDVTKCPSLGASAKETQANPLMDNFEGMYVKPSFGGHVGQISLISDDNFSATQTTRILNLAAILP